MDGVTTYIFYGLWFHFNKNFSNRKFSNLWSDVNSWSVFFKWISFLIMKMYLFIVFIELISFLFFIVTYILSILFLFEIQNQIIQAIFLNFFSISTTNFKLFKVIFSSQVKLILLFFIILAYLITRTITPVYNLYNYDLNPQISHLCW